MSFQRDEILAMNRPVARVVVAGSQGSVPREIGASMLVTEEKVSGTIGGGALEFEAIERARDVLRCGKDRLDRLPLGPNLGQCCGGAVTLLTEVWDAQRLQGADHVAARAVPGADTIMPLSVKRVLAACRNTGDRPQPGLINNWMIEPVTLPDREIWVWGAGHVGRALVSVLAPLPGFRVHWIDMDQSRFPEVLPNGVATMIASNPSDLVTLSEGNAEHFVLTFSHALDLEICHRVLSQPFRSLGLIGSATKRARFRKRLAVLGHGPAQIDRMDCPIGDPSLGKHPQAIALGVATALLNGASSKAGAMEQRA